MISTRLKSCRLAAALSLGLVAAGHGAAAQAACSYNITNSWGSGFTGEIEITNDGGSAITGWQVSWALNMNTITNSWNANLSGSYTASDMGWNGSMHSNISLGVIHDYIRT